MKKGVVGMVAVLMIAITVSVFSTSLVNILFSQKYVVSLRKVLRKKTEYYGCKSDIEIPAPGDGE